MVRYVVVMGEMGVWDGDGSGALDCVDESVRAVGHGEMVEPDVGGTEDGDAVTVAVCSEANVVGGVPDQTAGGDDNVVDVEAVDDHILGELDADTSTEGNVDIGAAGIDGLMAGHKQLFGQCNDHAPTKDDPQWLLLDCPVS